MGLHSLLTTGNVMNEDFCFHKIVNELDPVDFDEMCIRDRPLDKADYSRPAWALDSWRTVLEWSAGLPGQWGTGAQAALDGMPTALVRVGSRGAQDLTVASPSYTGRTMLHVECDADGFFYLRGASAGDYTGHSWQAGRVLRMRCV